MVSDRRGTDVQRQGPLQQDRQPNAIEADITEEYNLRERAKIRGDPG